MARFCENWDFRMFQTPNKRSRKVNYADPWTMMAAQGEIHPCAILTVQGEFLRGGGKRGLLRTAELRCPLAWPPSTENVAPMKRKHKYAERFQRH